MNRYEAREYVDRIHLLSDVAVNLAVRSECEPFLSEIGIHPAPSDEPGQLPRLTDVEAKRVSVRLCELEEEAQRMIALGDMMSDFRIIRNDGNGPGNDPKRANFNSLAKVVSIEHIKSEKLINGQVYKSDRFVAVGEKYTAPATYRTPDGVRLPTPRAGQLVNDSCISSTEGWVEIDGVAKPFGAATALAARLLEAKAEGAA